MNENSERVRGDREGPSDSSHHDRLTVSFRPANVLAFLLFIGLALFLVLYGWVPPRGSLTREKGRVTSVTKQTNTRYEAMIMTEKGLNLSCTGRVGWLNWADTCPIKRFMEIEGSEVTVVDDGKRFYEVLSDGDMVLGFGEFREAQLTTVILAFFSVACAFIAVLKRGR